MRFPRGSGLLLHPTSLPGEFGIGDLGPEAYRFVDLLAAAAQRVLADIAARADGFWRFAVSGVSPLLPATRS